MHMVAKRYLGAILVFQKVHGMVLYKAIEFARSGDKIVVWRLGRLERNMEDLITLVNKLNERDVSFHSLKEILTKDKSSSTRQLLFIYSQRLQNLNVT